LRGIEVALGKIRRESDIAAVSTLLDTVTTAARAAILPAAFPP